MTDLAAGPIERWAGADARTFARNDLRTSAVIERFVGGLAAVMRAAGYEQLDAPGRDTNVVLHAVDADAPRPYGRRAAPTFVIAVAELPAPPDDLLRTGYPLLVRCLANLCVLVSDTPDGLAVRFVTLEQGSYGVGPGLSDDELLARVFTRIEPLASSRLVIANEFVPDLPQHLWNGDEQTAEMLHAGRKLDALELLPAPFPIEDILGPRELRQVQLLYGIGGLSYGNVSTRYRGDDIGGVPDSDGPVFWMSASASTSPTCARSANTSCSSGATTLIATRWCSASLRTSTRGACRSTRSSTGRSTGSTATSARSSMSTAGSTGLARPR